MNIKRINGISDFLRNHAPDSVWMSMHDLFIMTEQKFPEIDYFSFKSILSQRVKQGWFKVSKANDGSPTRYLKNRSGS